ncbi:hypothetical protein PR048_027544 [Dryococelus australis]|uniref:Uncharacterized protein n=1 Tax=Dryococelus australis TaxID=614101 RepID=A0ABQ9GGU4_9NEOP|nr:hypothetical protein PR048_027544 [Dryococelus australis]
MQWGMRLSGVTNATDQLVRRNSGTRPTYEETNTNVQSHFHASTGFQGYSPCQQGQDKWQNQVEQQQTCRADSPASSIAPPGDQLRGEPQDHQGTNSYPQQQEAILFRQTQKLVHSKDLNTRVGAMAW